MSGKARRKARRYEVNVYMHFCDTLGGPRQIAKAIGEITEKHEGLRLEGRVFYMSHVTENPNYSDGESDMEYIRRFALTCDSDFRRFSRIIELACGKQRCRVVRGLAIKPFNSELKTRAISTGNLAKSSKPKSRKRSGKEVRK